MKLPRFRIAWVMVAIAIAAINFGAFRAAYDSQTGGVMLTIGALPMADVLILGILIARQSLPSRPFLLGFVVFGGIALALYVCLVTFCVLNGFWPMTWYLSFAFDPLFRLFRPTETLAIIAIEVPVAVLMLVGPQLVFALIGGFLSRRYRITITRRAAPIPPHE
jgi:hypothetical protein